ncbi:MAG: hypothetical protein J0L55_16890 [Caulobacterales bacterium]|nr:hypothetical protein [Caulobacterales bacterium]
MENMKSFYKYAAVIIVIGISSPSVSQIYDPAKISPEQKKREECVRLANNNAQKAINMAIDWRARFGSYDAEYCLGIANINNDNFEYGANKLIEIAPYFKARDIQFAAIIFSQAANGYLLAKMPENALLAINNTLEINKEDANALIDRARIYAELEKWQEAEIDLTNSMKLRGELALALRLRAETLLQQKKYSEALIDIERALTLEPKEVENYIIRGRIREAKRLSQKTQN